MLALNLPTKRRTKCLSSHKTFNHPPGWQAPLDNLDVKIQGFPGKCKALHMVTIDKSQHSHKGLAHKEKQGQTGNKLWKLITEEACSMRGQNKSMKYLETMSFWSFT